MSLKRSYDDTVQDSLTLSPRHPIDASNNAPAPLPSVENRSDTAQGKQRRLSFMDDNGECATASASSRPRALPSTSRARFVPGLQTFVGGLQMSQDSSIPRAAEMASRPPTAAPATRRSFDAPDAMQPLMMSRNADSERRASQSAAARRRSQEALEAIYRRTSLLAEEAQEAQLVPGVSPGWHVEAHGRQAMELQEGIRFEDEDGWTPLEAFPAATRQGKLVVKRAMLRKQQHNQQQKQKQQQQQQQQQHRRQQSELDALPSSSKSIPTISVQRASTKCPFEPSTSSSASLSVDDELLDDLLDTLSGPLMFSSPPPAIQHKPLPCSTAPSTSSLPSSPASPSTSSTTPISARSEESIAAAKLEDKSFAITEPKPRDTVSPRASPFSLSDFEVMETLGTGTFGRVLLVRLKDRDITDRSAYFALKVLAKSDVIRLKQVSHINSERNILTKVDHPFLVNMVASFQDSKNCYMLMEYIVGGEIFSYLRRAGQFSADVARFYISTIVLAIEYLHKNKVVYRDLKPENLLIDANGYTKITDFGFAKEVEDRTWTLCGTPEYLAPEIIQCSGHGSAVDWWSLGILLYEMLAGYPPFYDPNPILIYEKILAGKLIFPEQIDQVSRDLISSLLTADRSRRLGNLRGGASDVKNHPWFYGVDWKALQEGRIPPPIVPYLGQPGDTSNFSKYEAARQSGLPGLYGTDRGRHDPYAALFPDF
ncbi:probable cAMP-dependent protein kinase catalytic subunit [Ustilago trichophora]|uniref:cAMP-dependent protein kinase n=1 Tax=Ustilago trichophora TaxID=86804 RepID=A0A5C3DVS6_9BASI|nr:probable cAMP-dependent protein kinase catalytic subunit [Ustilago trichophora]